MALTPSRETGASIVTRAWMALMLTMLATSLYLPVSYALVKWTCRSDQRLPLLLVALVTAVTALGSAWFTWSRRARLQSRPHDPADDDKGLGRFSADVALGTTLMLLLFVAVSTFAPLVLSPCE
jgi:hypothetical protein